MSISINSTYGNYAANYAYNSYAAETANNSKSTSKKESTASETKQYSNANEYAKYLSEKYAYFGKTASVYGVPTTITVSSAYLQKCANDPEEAKVLERNLAAVPECTKQGEARLKSVPGSPVTTYRNVVIDENGHISSISGCTNDPDGKIARENAQRKAEEKKAAAEKSAEKAAKRRAEKKEKEEKIAEQRAEKERQYHMRIEGKDVEDVTRKFVDNVTSSNSGSSTGSNYSA